MTAAVDASLPCELSAAHHPAPAPHTSESRCLMRTQTPRHPGSEAAEKQPLLQAHSPSPKTRSGPIPNWGHCKRNSESTFQPPPPPHHCLRSRKTPAQHLGVVWDPAQPLRCLCHKPVAVACAAHPKEGCGLAQGGSHGHGCALCGGVSGVGQPVPPFTAAVAPRTGAGVAPHILAAVSSCGNKPHLL